MKSFKFHINEVIINKYNEKYLITEIWKENLPFSNRFWYTLLDCKKVEYKHGLKNVIESKGYFKRYFDTLTNFEVRHKETQICIDTLIIRNFKYIPLHIRYYDYLLYRLNNYCLVRNLDVKQFEIVEI